MPPESLTNEMIKDSRLSFKWEIYKKESTLRPPESFTKEIIKDSNLLFKWDICKKESTQMLTLWEAPLLRQNSQVHKQRKTAI